MLPCVERRSPAISTPPGNFSATIVVPCGRDDPSFEPIESPLPVGNRCGACLRRKSENEDVSTDGESAPDAE
jgi:hypothetical protein